MNRYENIEKEVNNLLTKKESNRAFYTNALENVDKKIADAEIDMQHALEEDNIDAFTKAKAAKFEAEAIKEMAETKMENINNNIVISADDYERIRSECLEAFNADNSAYMAALHKILDRDIIAIVKAVDEIEASRKKCADIVFRLNRELFNYSDAKTLDIHSYELSFFPAVDMVKQEYYKIKK